MSLLWQRGDDDLWFFLPTSNFQRCQKALMMIHCAHTHSPIEGKERGPKSRVHLAVSISFEIDRLIVSNICLEQTCYWWGILRITKVSSIHFIFSSLNISWLYTFLKGWDCKHDSSKDSFWIGMTDDREMYWLCVYCCIQNRFRITGLEL